MRAIICNFSQNSRQFLTKFQKVDLLSTNARFNRLQIRSKWEHVLGLTFWANFSLSLSSSAFFGLFNNVDLFWVYCVCVFDSLPPLLLGLFFVESKNSEHRTTRNEQQKLTDLQHTHTHAYAHLLRLRGKAEIAIKIAFVIRFCTQFRNPTVIALDRREKYVWHAFLHALERSFVCVALF